MFLMHLFLQATQAVQSEPFSSSAITYGIIAAIGGFIAWAIKTTLPKVIDQFEKRTDALTLIVGQLPKAIESLGNLVTEVRNDIKSTLSKELDGMKGEIIGAVQDQKLKELADKVECHDKILKEKPSDK